MRIADDYDAISRRLRELKEPGQPTGFIMVPAVLSPDDVRALEDMARDCQRIFDTEIRLAMHRVRLLRESHGRRYTKPAAS